MPNKLTILSQLERTLLHIASYCNQRIAEVSQASAADISALEESKQDKSVHSTFTIPASGWGSDSTADYPYYYDIAVSGVTASDRADVPISPASVSVAASCGICPFSETLAGKIRIRAAKVPTEEISAEYWIEKG